MQQPIELVPFQFIGPGSLTPSPDTRVKDFRPTIVPADHPDVKDLPLEVEEVPSGTGNDDPKEGTVTGSVISSPETEGSPPVPIPNPAAVPVTVASVVTATKPSDPSKQTT